MDIKTELTVLRRTGKFVMGFRQSYLAMLRRESKVVLVAKDCPEEFRRELSSASRMTGVQVVETDLSSLELGRLLGKPFHASTVAVLDPGTSSLGKGG
jgi:large subunit ribosomal protein L30e